MPESPTARVHPAEQHPELDGQPRVAPRHANVVILSAAQSAVARWGGIGVLILASAAVALWHLALAPGQWFVFDEFDYFTKGHDPLIVWLLRPHNEHTIAFTKIWYNALLPIVGLRHYILYLVPLVLAHLVVVAAIYRLTWISTASQVVAAGTALIAAVMGAGAGTLTWAGQFQYVGSVAAGLIAIVLAFEARTRRRIAAVGVIALFGTLNGTAFVALGLAAALAYAYHRRWPEAVLMSAIPVAWQLVIRLVWAPANPYAAGSLGEILRVGPSFIFSVLDTAISQTVGYQPMSAALLVSIAVGTLALLFGHVSRHTRLAGPVIGTLALATVVSMAALVAGRLGRGAELAGGGGYSYLFLATLIPMVGILLGQLARSKAALFAVAGMMVVISSIGYGKITDDARALSAWKLDGERLIQASAALLVEGLPTYMEQMPVPDTAPTVSQDMIRFWVAAGQLDALPVSPGATDQASLNMQWRLIPGQEVAGQCISPVIGEHIAVPPGAELSVSGLSSGTAITIHYPTSPAQRQFDLSNSVSVLQSVAARAASVSVVAGSARVCIAE